MNRSKQLGTLWETAVVNFLREHGWPHVERRTLGGAKDRGDIAGIIGLVIECKNAARILPGPWLKEAHAERDNDGADLGVVWAKRRGKSSAGDGYVVMDGHTFAHLLKQAER